MGGQSSQNTTSNQTQNQTQNSTTNPWAVAQPALTGILGQLNGGLNNTGVTGAENNALTGLTNNATNYGQTFAPQIANYADTLFRGGGATDQAGNINQNYQSYLSALNGSNNSANANLATLNGRLGATADGSNMGQNPGLQAQLDQIRTDVTNQVNPMFAAAGRDFSGANLNTLGRGIASGEAPVIAGQYNIDNTNRINAANSLYGAGNTTNALTAANAGAGYNSGVQNYGILAGLQQQALANQGQGAAAAGQSLDASNAGNNAALLAEAQRRGIPVQALGLLAQIGIPIAGLGSSSSGTSTGTSNGTQNTVNQMSPVQQFTSILGGIGSLGNLWPRQGKQ